MVCQIFSVFYKQISKNISYRIAWFRKNIINSINLGETELKMITDSAHRYLCSHHVGVAVGIKLARCLEALSMHTYVFS
jgi:hypothetical protein